MSPKGRPEGEYRSAQREGTPMSSTRKTISPSSTIAEQIAAVIASLPRTTPPAMETICRSLLVDVAGLCIAARHSDFMQATLAATDEPGACTVIGQPEGRSPGMAALCNGTAAHGDDFDDTYEGGPVHAGAVIVPAILATAEMHGLTGDDAGLGIATGCEVMCRMCLVTPKLVHQAGFHPTAVFGAIGAAAGVGAALRLERKTARRRDGNRRQHVVGNHRISGRRRVDQAHASGLGGAVRLSRRAVGAGRLRRPAHRVRG